jgi:hypothetical protein
MAQGDDNSAADVSFTIPELVCDPNQTFEIDTEDFPANLDTQTWEWWEIAPMPSIHRQDADVITISQLVFGDTMAPNGEFPRWVPENTILGTVQAIRFLCGRDGVNARRLLPKQIKNYMDADDDSTVVPVDVATMPFFRAINQIQHCRYILSLGRERGLEAINGPGVVRTKRDRENSLGMIENVNTRYESLLESLSPEQLCFKIESEYISEETRQLVNPLAQRPINEFRAGMIELPVANKREIVAAFDGGLVNTARVIGKDARTGNKVRAGGVKGHKVTHGATGEIAKRQAEYQSRLDVLSQEHINASYWDLCGKIANEFGVVQRTVHRNIQALRKKIVTDKSSHCQ